MSDANNNDVNYKDRFDTNARLQIGDRIEELMKKHKLSQAELADSIGLSVEQMSRIKNGRYKSLDSRIMVCLAEKLSTTSDFLLTGRKNRDDLLGDFSKIVKDRPPDERDKAVRILMILFDIDEDPDGTE